jgi:hypothetical protein
MRKKKDTKSERRIERDEEQKRKHGGKKKN